jgi:hypothetical protein
MNSNIIPTNIALTDSFSLKIPFDDCEILDHRLTSDTFIYYESIDHVDEERYPPKPLKIEKDGITIRIGLAQIPIFDANLNTKVDTKFISLTVSSKLLRENYFEGITNSNIKTIYETFIDFNIFYCSYDTFMCAHLSDIDICINRYSYSVSVFSDALDILQSQTGTKSKHLFKVSEQSNVGLSFGTRQSAKPSLPFIKLYHKELELLTKSAEFYNTFLFPKYAQAVKNLTRIEATIRNYKHKQRLAKYGILPEFRTLQDFLSIPQSDLYNFVVFSVNGYIETKPRQHAPDLSPSDHMLYEAIQSLIIAGHDFETLKHQLIDGFKGTSPSVTDVSRSRMRKKFKDLFDLLVHKDLKIASVAQYNAHVHSYLEFLNLK